MGKQSSFQWHKKVRQGSNAWNPSDQPVNWQAFHANQAARAQLRNPWRSAVPLTEEPTAAVPPTPATAPISQAARATTAPLPSPAEDVPASDPAVLDRNIERFLDACLSKASRENPTPYYGAWKKHFLHCLALALRSTEVHSLFQDPEALRNRFPDYLGQALLVAAVDQMDGDSPTHGTRCLLKQVKGGYVLDPALADNVEAFAKKCLQEVPLPSPQLAWSLRAPQYRAPREGRQPTR